MTEISQILLKQRIRNRIMESLQCFIDTEAVESLGTDEIINGWDDWLVNGVTDFYDEPVFTLAETAALKRFHTNLESRHGKVPSTWKSKDLINSQDWKSLRNEARVSLDVFMVRGLMDEDNVLF